MNSGNHTCLHDRENFTFTKPHTKEKGNKGISHQFKNWHPLFTEIDYLPPKSKTNIIFIICNKNIIFMKNDKK